MRNLKQYLKPVFMLTMFGVLIFATAAFSAQADSNGNIFDTLEYKIYATLHDLRQIVYVISGFGLVMFAVAAIFNKISYKHLGYIMIGLSLLSLMFPFLEYFSGATGDTIGDRNLEFESFIYANKSQKYDTDSQTYQMQATSASDITDPNYKGETPGVPGELSDSELDAMMAEAEQEMQWELERQMSEYFQEGGLNNLPDTVPVGGVDVQSSDFAKMVQAGCSPSSLNSKSKWSANGTRNVCSVSETGVVQISQETCEGKIENGVCKKTAWQKLGDVWQTINSGVNAGQNAGTAVAGGIGAIADVWGAIQQGGAIVGGDGTFLDKLNQLANLTHNTAGATGTVTRDLNQILGGLIGIGGDVSNTAVIWSSNGETNPEGANDVSDAIKAINDWLHNRQNDVTNAGGVVDTGASAGNAVYNTGKNVDAATGTFNDALNRLKGIFGK